MPLLFSRMRLSVFCPPPEHSLQQYSAHEWAATPIDDNSLSNCIATEYHNAPELCDITSYDSSS